MDELILQRLEEAFINTSSNLYKEIKRLSAASESGHFEYMIDNSIALKQKIRRCSYVKDLIGKQGGARILDFGSGCGFLSCYLSVTRAKSVIGVEIHEGRRKAAEFLAKEVFEAQNIEFKTGIDELTPESFDSILLVNVISHAQKLPEVLVELSRLLKSYGLIFIEDNNNFGSLIVRRRLRVRLWPGGKNVFRPMRYNYIRRLYDNLPEEKIEVLASETYGLTYPEIKNFLDYYLEKNRVPFDTTFLKSHAPVDPKTGMYHENAFKAAEVETMLFNVGLVPVRTCPKYVFDFKQNRIVSFVFRRFPKLSLRVSPAFEILAVKK